MAIISVAQNADGALDMSGPDASGWAQLFNFDLTVTDSAELYDQVQQSLESLTAQ